MPAPMGSGPFCPALLTPPDMPTEVTSGPQSPVRHLAAPFALGQLSWLPRRNSGRLELGPDRSRRGRVATAEPKHAPPDRPELLGIAPLGLASSLDRLDGAQSHDLPAC